MKSPSLFTGEGFSNEKILAYVAAFAGTLTLLVMAFDVYQNHKLRKLTTLLTQAQLDEIQKKNGIKQV